MMPGDWQSIETAPLDGTVVMLKGGTTNEEDMGYRDRSKLSRPVTAWFDSDWFGGSQWRFASYDAGHYGEYLDPTHWRPLPDEKA